MCNKEDTKDIREYLQVDELIKLSDLEVMLLRTNSKKTFLQLEKLIDKYYEIARMRKKIQELKRNEEKTEEGSDDT